VSPSRAADARSAAFQIRKFAAAGVILLWIALLAGILGRFAWPLDLFAHFRIHYCALFSALTLALLFLRRPMLAIASLTGAVVSFLPVVGYTRMPAQSASAHSEALRVVSLNVWFRNHDYARMAEYLRATNADAIVLQEATRPAAQRLHALLPSYRYAHIDKEWHGAAVLSKWPLQAAASRPLAGYGSRAAYVQFEWRGSPLTLLGVHLHWPLGAFNAHARNAELIAVSALARAQAGPMLVVGDFNTTQWSYHFQRAVREAGLKDCARGQQVAASWPSYVSWIGIRIDHCLASRHWRVIDIRTGPHVGSDHRPLIMDLALEAG
jgi:endonuclease/exonuclease/phosphatase (EEP) superfamily protein YafD